MPSGLWDLKFLDQGSNPGPSSKDPGSQLKSFSRSWASSQPSLALGLSRIHLLWLTHSLEHDQGRQRSCSQTSKKNYFSYLMFSYSVEQRYLLCPGGAADSEPALGLMFLVLTLNVFFLYRLLGRHLFKVKITYNQYPFLKCFRAYKMFSCAVP